MLLDRLIAHSHCLHVNTLHIEVGVAYADAQDRARNIIIKWLGGPGRLATLKTNLHTVIKAPILEVKLTFAAYFCSFILSRFILSHLICLKKKICLPANRVENADPHNLKYLTMFNSAPGERQRKSSKHL